ncbi:hypothetical protein GALMADRAFT_157806 [Galerina marginata CBS 339.88]|uniref:Integrase zinc-binding domain-containing protein n=1 Tax=Galerina marginata (strain CBS 339.88) TaxID=685588 RepID=A0A067T4S5_GALM3|nr:hypothetical protein GALMADRAFT_157806 [Galerina marginata CBS 339.88]
MTPARRPSGSSRRNSSGGFKPYTRGVSPIMVSSLSNSPRPDKSASPANHTDTIPSTTTAENVERPGFPTYAQYKQVEKAYLQGLTPRRQGKALISQAMFDRIWDVLHQELPESSSETAQFRFWARKMFTVSRTHRVTLGVVDHADDTPQEVLLHDNLLVAIQEQLYDLLCYCHGSTGHGGRDKTCLLIRKHYTWVPKDLVSNFIKACPTCIMKKCGNAESAAVIARMSEARSGAEDTSLRDLVQNHMYIPDGSVPSSPLVLGSPHATSSACNGIPWPTTGGPADSPFPPSMLDEDPLEAAYRQAILRARGFKTLAGFTGSSNTKGLHGHLMSREVSLYKGLPNGWQYRHNDYASAHADFMQNKDSPIVQNSEFELDNSRRPRVPSIAPLWGPDNFPHPGQFGDLDGPDMGDSDVLSVLDVSPDLGSEQREHRHGHFNTSGIMMHDLLTPHRPENNDYQDGFMHQLDPMLMSFSGTTPTHEARYEPPASPSPSHVHGHQTPTSTLATTTVYPSSSSIKRAAAPPRLSLFPSEKTFQALLAYRDGLGDGNTSPNSPLGNNGRRWHPGNPSPASSSSSSSSSRSSFILPMEADSALTTPSSSAITTPVDECAGGAGGSGLAAEFVKGKGAEMGEKRGLEAGEGILDVC